MASTVLTLAQHMMMSNDPLVLKITESLLVNAQILQYLPIETKAQLKNVGSRFDGADLPTVTWADINGTLTNTSASPTPYEENIAVIRNVIEVDTLLLKNKFNIGDPRANIFNAYLRSLSYDINDKFINNDPLTGDAKAFTGLRFRLDNPSFYNVPSELKFNAGGVDMRAASLTSATVRTLSEYMDTVLTYLGADEGQNVVILMGETLKNRLSNGIKALGAGGGFNTVQDAFDRSVMAYKNAPILNIGRKADQTSKIITSTEASDGSAGSSGYTSIYFVKMGENDFSAWQMEPLRAQSLGLIGGTGITDRTLIEWTLGLNQAHTRSIGRIYGIQVQ